MNIRRFASTLAVASLISGGGIALDLASSFTPLAQQAQAAYYQNCSFTGKIAFSPTNVRSQTNTGSSIVKQFWTVGEQVKFSSFDYGQSIADAWTGQPDNMWFKLADGSGYIASAVVNGYPPTSQCSGTPPTSGNSTLGIAVNWNSAAYRQNNPFWRAYAPPSVGGTLNALGNCTWYANGRLRELGYSGTSLSRLLGNAYEWANQARNAGIPVGTSPRVGAVAQWNTNHVAVVEQVNSNGTIVISESSYPDFLYKQRTISASNPSNYIYVPR
jgi:surface antigen